MLPPTPCLRAPLLWLLLPFMGGITAARFFPAPVHTGLLALLALAALGATLAAWFALRPGSGAHAGWILSLGLAAGLAGFACLSLRYPHWRETSDRPPREVTVTIEVEETYSPSATRAFTGYATIVAASASEQNLLGRRVYFSAIRKISVPPHRAGQYLMRGVLEPLPAEPAPMSFDDYLANLGIRQKLTRVQLVSEQSPPGGLMRFYNRTADHLTTILRHGLDGHPTVSTLYLAMLLGSKAALSPEQKNAFMRSGTFHVFSISGLHVGVIATAIYSAFSLFRVSRRNTVLLSLPILWFYVQVTGANYPALRALIMISFFLGSQVLRQPMNGLASLSAAALATLLYDPLQLFSSGFQMSYTVVLALVVMSAPLSAHWLARWRPFWGLPRINWRWRHHRVEEAGRAAIRTAAACWVAFLASLPPSIGYFQLLSPGSLLANVIIIPLSSLTIISGFLSLLCGLGGLSSLSFLFNHAAGVTIITMDRLLQAGMQLPGVYYPARFTASWMTPAALVFMSGLLLACQAGRWSRRYGGYWPPVVAALAMIAWGVRFE